MKNLKMNKIINTNTHDCFFHADAQGRVYIGKGEKGGITLSIYDATGDIRDFTVKDQIVCSDILLCDPDGAGALDTTAETDK